MLTLAIVSAVLLPSLIALAWSIATAPEAIETDDGFQQIIREKSTEGQLAEEQLIHSR